MKTNGDKAGRLGARDRLSRFSGCRSGIMFLKFALMLPLVLAIILSGIDYAWTLTHKAVLQDAADTAAIAGAKQLSMADAKHENVEAVVTAMVERYIADNRKSLMKKGAIAPIDCIGVCLYGDHRSYHAPVRRAASRVEFKLRPDKRSRAKRHPWGGAAGFPGAVAALRQRTGLLRRARRDCAHQLHLARLVAPHDDDLSGTGGSSRQAADDDLMGDEDHGLRQIHLCDVRAQPCDLCRAFLALIEKRVEAFKRGDVAEAKEACRFQTAAPAARIDLRFRYAGSSEHVPGAA